MLRFIFVTLPCALWDLWWIVYTFTLTAFVMVCVSLTVLVLLLDALGYRWAW